MSDIPEIEINFSDFVSGMTIPNIEVDLLGEVSGNLSDLIFKVEKELLQRYVNLIAIKIKGDHIINDLIKVGFLPTHIADNTKRYDQDTTWMLIDHYIEKFNPETIKFWFRNSVLEEIIGKTTVGWYFYANIRGWKDFSSKTSISLPLLMYASDQVYKSKRSKTDMLIFRQATSAIYNQIQDTNEKYIKTIIGDNFKLKGLPVTRYASGMSKGLYYNETSDKKFCGTFYYLEPESTTYLTFNSYVIFRNKYEAAKFLIGDDQTEFSDPSIDQYYNNPDKFLYPDLMMTPEEYLKFWKVKSLPLQENRKHYVGRHFHLYALEDDYDQEICQAARDNGYDVIILTHMVGAFQLVTEILDTRDRVISLSNLIYPAYN